MLQNYLDGRYMLIVACNEYDLDAETETLNHNDLALQLARLVRGVLIRDRDAALDHFMDRTSRPTAIVCLHDVFAIAAMAGCSRRKLRVPEQSRSLDARMSRSPLWCSRRSARCAFPL